MAASGAKAQPGCGLDYTLNENVDVKGRVLPNFKKAALRQIRSAELANKSCFECGEAHPTWLSSAHGILVCLSCSGQHRHLGVHLTLVRSVELDELFPEELLVLEVGGNARAAVALAASVRSPDPIGDDNQLTHEYNTKVAAAHRVEVERMLASALRSRGIQPRGTHAAKLQGIAASLAAEPGDPVMSDARPHATASIAPLRSQRAATTSPHYAARPSLRGSLSIDPSMTMPILQRRQSIPFDPNVPIISQRRQSIPFDPNLPVQSFATTSQRAVVLPGRQSLPFDPNLPVHSFATTKRSSPVDLIDMTDSALQSVATMHQSIPADLIDLNQRRSVADLIDLNEQRRQSIRFDPIMPIPSVATTSQRRSVADLIDLSESATTKNAQRPPILQRRQSIPFDPNMPIPSVATTSQRRNVVLSRRPSMPFNQNKPVAFDPTSVVQSQRLPINQSSAGGGYPNNVVSKNWVASFSGAPRPAGLVPGPCIKQVGKPYDASRKASFSSLASFPPGMIIGSAKMNPIQKSR